VLLSVIDANLEEKAEVIKTVLDSLKMYINPAIFKEELISRGELVDDYARVNSEFEEQSRIGHATGYLQSSERVQDYLRKFYSDVPHDESGIVYLSGEQGIEVAPQRAPRIDDSEELG